MKATLSDGSSEWHELWLEFSSREIDLLIQGLREIQKGQDHLHCWRREMKGDSGVYNIEISCTGEEESADMEVQLAPPIEPTR